MSEERKKERKLPIQGMKVRKALESAQITNVTWEIRTHLAPTFDNFDNVDKFFDRHKPPELTQEK